MEAYDILVTAVSSLIMLIVIHISVFGVVRWLYPTPSPQQQVRFAEPPTVPAPPPPPPPFTQPTQERQEVNVPTYAPPVPVEAPREDGRGELGKPSGTPAERPTWLVAVDPKTLDA